MLYTALITVPTMAGRLYLSNSRPTGASPSSLMRACGSGVTFLFDMSRNFYATDVSSVYPVMALYIPIIIGTATRA